jgi:hypothetical protein
LEYNGIRLDTKSIAKFIGRRQVKSEIKWLNSAKLFTSVSPHYVAKIAELIKKPGYVLLNGFDLRLENSDKSIPGQFNITYNGSLYNSQEIEPFLSAVKRLILENDTNIQISLQFPGLAFDKFQAKRVSDLCIEFSSNLKITERISKEEVIAIQAKSDILVMISHKNIKGIPSSKLYEYIGLKKPILLFPNDFDIIQETLNKTGLGLICDDSESIYNRLKALLIMKVETGNIRMNYNSREIDMFSKKNQIANLSVLLDCL